MSNRPAGDSRYSTHEYTTGRMSEPKKRTDGADHFLAKIQHWNTKAMNSAICDHSVSASKKPMRTPLIKR